MQTVANGEGKTSPSFSDEFAANCKLLFDKNFGAREERKFTLRPSNLGRPHCQLVAEKEGWPREPNSYDFAMKMFIGDMVEAAVVSILRASGVGFEHRIKVEGEIFGKRLVGEADLLIDGKLYDVKSMSKWAFDHKLGTVKDFVGDGDPFGYLGQAFLYAELAGKPFGGWICVCKEDGRWAVLEITDSEYNGFRDDALRILAANIKAVDNPFARAFTDEAETFRKVPTGNRVLKYTCGMCAYKWKCWPALKQLPALASEAKNPSLTYYTEIDKKWIKDAESDSAS